MPWLFLTVSLIGAWFTFNAYIPQRRTGPLVVPSFFAGWLTSELSAHHFAWQLAATLFFVWAGALRAWPGWVGLGITLASWLGLLASWAVLWSFTGLAPRFPAMAPIALATIAQMFILCVNELDLSIGAFVSLVACITATWLHDTPLLGIAALAGLIVAAVAAAPVQALGVHLLNVGRVGQEVFTGGRRCPGANNAAGKIFAG